jgi:transcriptional regulator with XRE-family HTH domain
MTTFGAMLRRLREARTMLVPIQHGNYRTELVVRTLSMNELGRRAGLSAGAIWRLEAGENHPHRPSVLRVAAALELGDLETALLLVAAGYWPWPELEALERHLVVATALGVVQGDYRRADQAEAAIAAEHDIAMDALWHGEGERSV